MNKSITVLIIISLTFLFGVSCSSDASSGKLPQMNFEPKIISFDNLILGAKSRPQTLKIISTGVGDLKINEIFFQRSSDGKLDYSIDSINGVEYDKVVYPIVLKNKEFANVKLYMTPTEDGVKKGVLEIDTNIEDKQITKTVELVAEDFFPELQIDEAVGSNHLQLRKKIKDLTVKKCVANKDLRSMINICNMGKASLKVHSVKLEGDSLALEYYELETLNTPAKIPGTFVSNQGICITGFAICHNGDSGLEANLIINSNSEFNSEQTIKLVSQ